MAWLIATTLLSHSYIRVICARVSYASNFEWKGYTFTKYKNMKKISTCSVPTSVLEYPEISTKMCCLQRGSYKREKIIQRKKIQFIRLKRPQTCDDCD